MKLGFTTYENLKGLDFAKQSGFQVIRKACSSASGSCRSSSGRG